MRGGSSCARAALQQPLKSAADGVSRHEQLSSLLRSIRCCAATAPGAAQHTHMIPRRCACAWLADSATTVMLFVRMAVFFMIPHCCRLPHFTTHEKIASSLWLRPDMYEQLGRPLGSGQLGRWDARRQRIALCAARCARGSSSFAPGSKCVSPPSPACMSASLGSEAALGRCVSSCATSGSGYTDRRPRPRAPVLPRGTGNGMSSHVVTGLWGTSATFWTLRVGRESGTWDSCAKNPVLSASRRAGGRPRGGEGLFSHFCFLCQERIFLCQEASGNTHIESRRDSHRASGRIYVCGTSTRRGRS